MSQAEGVADPWVIYDYEVHMLLTMCTLLVPGNDDYAKYPREVKNAITECALLHARQVVDILLCKGKDADDILLKNLLPEFQSDNLTILHREYGTRSQENSICWTINKRLAHATTVRGPSCDYGVELTKTLEVLRPLLMEIQISRRGDNPSLP
ncbi:MAG: hypothetical protein SGJ20_11190 [Planctomycetota bacterium]|nr:hypothetical protein [Planctomycetota bacterium]